MSLHAAEERRSQSRAETRRVIDETGIQFKAPAYMASLPFNTDIRADNWKDAIRKLLDDYSTVEVWTDKPETSRIWVLLSTPYVPKSTETPRPTRVSYNPPPIVPAPIPYNPVPPVVNLGSQNITISMLPSHILFEPGVLTFFKSKGIQLPENVKNMYGPNLERLPPNMPISPHILNDPMFLSYLESVGLQPPTG